MIFKNVEVPSKFFLTMSKCLDDSLEFERPSGERRGGFTAAEDDVPVG